MKKHSREIVAACLLIALSACSPKSADEATAGEPQADVGMVAESVTNAAEAASTTHPLCGLATFAEVQAAGGGNVSQLDVSDIPELNEIGCNYIDQDNYLSAGMSIGFVTTDRLVKSASKWTSAADYFAEWTRNSTAVPGLAEGAAWVDSLGSTELYVLKGDKVVKFSATGIDASSAAVRAKLEALAQQVASRMQ